MTTISKEFTEIKELLNKTFKIFSKKLETLVMLKGIVIGIIFIATVLFLILGFLGGIGIYFLADLIFYKNNFEFGILFVLAIIFFISCYVIIITLITPLGQAALIKALSNAGDKHKKTIKEYCLFAWNLKWRIWGLYLLSILLTLIGLIFFIIPGLVIGFFLLFAPFVLILENKRIIECIEESFLMVKNNFVNVLIKYVLIVLLIIIITTIANFIPLASIAISFLASIFSTIYVYLLYIDIKNVKNVSVDKS